MSELADAVLPLIRTRADLYRWAAANQHGREMHEAVDILEAAIPDADPAEVYSVTHRALTSAIKVIARADDSSGVIGDACRRLLELHPRAAMAGRVAPAELVEWMIKFQFEGDVDYFTVDPLAYAPALGDKGVATYRARLDEIRDRLEPEAPDQPWYSGNHTHERFVLMWNARRLAVLDRDVDAIIQTHARDRKVAAWLHDTAEALAEIGEIELAIDWAKQATDFDRGHQSLRASGYWCKLLEQHRPSEALDARHQNFQRWPSATTAAYLYRSAGKAWNDYRDQVLSTLEPNPREAVLFTLLTLKDPEGAWDLANSLDLTDTSVWNSLIKEYEKLNPLAVLPAHQRLVEQELRDADAKHYRLAARRLATMRKLAAGSDHDSNVEQLIADLRETYRRRPRLQQEFDRVGLP